jgi:hypothetical protein
MSPEDEQDLLERTDRIERRIVWIGHVVIGIICFCVYYFVSHNGTAQAYWHISDDGMFWVGVGAAVVLGGILETAFNQS